jgi:hypothetical protein
MGFYQSKHEQTMVVATFSACQYQANEPEVAWRAQIPLSLHHHALSHLPYCCRIAEDHAPEQIKKQWTIYVGIKLY